MSDTANNISWKRSEKPPSRGGNAEVYAVTNDGSVEYAQKVLLRPERYERFRREAAIAASLRHDAIPKIVDTYLPDQYDERDRPFFVMPWLDGGSLRTLLRQGALEPKRVLELLAPLLDALTYLHEQRKAHRDVKPANVMLTSRGEVYLTDFGLAFDLDDLRDRLTAPREIVGSLSYRAPEYVIGGVVEGTHAPGDIYSLGRTLWALAAGREPAEGTDLRFPEYSLARSGASREHVELQSLVVWMTQADPSSRPSILEVRSEIARMLTPPPPPSRSRDLLPEIGRELQRLQRTDPTTIERARVASKSQEMLDVARRHAATILAVMQQSNRTTSLAEIAGTNGFRVTVGSGSGADAHFSLWRGLTPEQLDVVKREGHAEGARASLLPPFAAHDVLPSVHCFVGLYRKIIDGEVHEKFYVVSYVAVTHHRKHATFHDVVVYEISAYSPALELSDLTTRQLECWHVRTLEALRDG